MKVDSLSLTTVHNQIGQDSQHDKRTRHDNRIQIQKLRIKVNMDTTKSYI